MNCSLTLLFHAHINIQIVLSVLNPDILATPYLLSKTNQVLHVLLAEVQGSQKILIQYA